MCPASHPPLVLRPWRRDDAGALVEIFASTSDLATQYPAGVTNEAEAEACLDRLLGWDDGRRNLALIEAGRPAGNVGLTNIDRRHDTAWVSFWSTSRARGRGLVRRAVSATASWGLRPAPSGLGLFRLELGHRVNNPASGAVARHAGFVVEGRERQKLRYGDERFDTILLARLASDPVPPIDGVTFQLG